MSSLMAASYVVESYDRVFDIQFYDRKLCCRVLWPRAMLSRFRSACYDVKFYGRVLRYRDSWPGTMMFCDIVYTGNSLKIKNLIKIDG